MPLPASYWAAVIVFLLTGMLCRRWPSLALYGASSAFCTVHRGLLLYLPDDPCVFFMDAVYFVLPTMTLVRSCGVNERMSVLSMLLVPVAFVFGESYGNDVRRSLLILGISTMQGMGTIVAFAKEARARSASFDRRIAACIAAIGPLGLAFVADWNDVAWTGVAVHAFACLAYLVHEQE